MDGHVSLSRREKYQHFFYLLILTIVATVLISFIFLRNYDSPFGNKIAYEMQLLDQKNKFEKFQKDIYPFLQSTYNKIDGLPQKNIQSFVETDIKNSINDIANASKNNNLFDPRGEDYYQLAKFYKMYFEDKIILGKKTDNIILFEKQFTECSIGFKEKEQQLTQKNAAISSRNN